MIELEAAQERILSRLPSASVEQVLLADADGRFLAQDVFASLDLPGFDNSAMDGYAVCAADVARANQTSPVQLKLSGRVTAGEIISRPLNPGECIRIFTGSMLPPGADAVVMQEECRVTGDCVEFKEATRPWENVRFRGEDFKSGATLATTGSRLNAGQLALIAATGKPDVLVARQPQVGLLATGSELTEPGKPLAAGKIYESNRLGLSALARRWGAVTRLFPLVEDSPAATCAALENAFSQCDLLITSGGVSVGEMDFVKSAFTALGGTLDFWRVNIRPGKPFAFGEWNGKFLFGLPGNPVSAFVTFLMLVRPAILRWQGAARLDLPVSAGTLVEPLVNSGDRRHLLRVLINETGEVRLAGKQSSHLLTSLAAANGLVDLPSGAKLEPGARVNVLRWD